MDENEVTAATFTLRDLLVRLGMRLVLAESCTAGRVAATLATLPGISAHLCGSFVVYRSDSKVRWLGISPDVLDDPHIGPVSSRVSSLLALAALEITPEADLAVAVTGDVGPGAPPQTDGRVFISSRRRQSQDHEEMRQDVELQLKCPAPIDQWDLAARLARLEEATLAVLNTTIEFLQSE